MLPFIENRLESCITYGCSSKPTRATHQGLLIRMSQRHAHHTRRSKGFCGIGMDGEGGEGGRGLGFAMRNATCECTSSNYIEYADAMKTTMIESHIIICAGERNSVLIRPIMQDVPSP